MGLDRSRQQLEAIGIDSREISRNVEKANLFTNLILECFPISLEIFVLLFS